MSPSDKAANAPHVSPVGSHPGTGRDEEVVVVRLADFDCTGRSRGPQPARCSGEGPVLRVGIGEAGGTTQKHGRFVESSEASTTGTQRAAVAAGIYRMTPTRNATTATTQGGTQNLVAWESNGRILGRARVL